MVMPSLGMVSSVAIREPPQAPAAPAGDAPLSTRRASPPPLAPPLPSSPPSPLLLRTHAPGAEPRCICLDLVHLFSNLFGEVRGFLLGARPASLPDRPAPPPPLSLLSPSPQFSAWEGLLRKGSRIPPPPPDSGFRCGC